MKQTFREVPIPSRNHRLQFQDCKNGRLPATSLSKRKPYIVFAGKHQINFGHRTVLMGIVNVTPDSFSQDGCLRDCHTTRRAVRLAKKQIRDGADIIDIGGESSRPGARRISSNEERARVIPVLEALSKKCKTPISVDTYKTAVAKAALDAGACIVNTIKGTNPDHSLLKMVKNYGAAIVLMHMRGIPGTMQKNIHYSNLIGEIISSLSNSIEKCLEIGINSDKIIIDPGIGFGKTVEHNLEILNRLNEFHRLQHPLLIGTSRKSFIGTILNRDVGHRLQGTAATVSAGILRGAHMVRVHDVKAIKETVTITDAIVNEHYR